MKTKEIILEAVVAVSAEFSTADRVKIGIELSECQKLIEKMQLFAEYTKVRYNESELEKFKQAHPNFKEETFRKNDWQTLCEEFATKLDYLCIPLRKVALDMVESDVFTNKTVEYKC